MQRHRPSVKSVSERVRVIPFTPVQHFPFKLKAFFFPFATGHFSYECKATRPYVSRPSRTAQLENPRLFAESKRDAHPSVDVPEEFKNKFVFYFYLLLARLTEGVRSYG